MTILADFGADFKQWPHDEVTVLAMPNLPLLFSLSWIARVVFLARTLLCVRAEKEKRNFFDPFVRSGRERKKKIFPVFRFFPFFARKRYAETKKNTRAFGQRKKKRIFLRGKGMQKQKKHACVRAEKEKNIFFRFFPFFAGKRSVETIKKWNESNKWSERNN